MAWMSSLLFARAEPTALAVALEELLACGERRADPDGLVSDPPPVVVTPRCDEWVAVTGLRAWIEDLGWAASRLARACNTTVASSELLGNSYRYRFSEHAADSERRKFSVPDGDWASFDAPAGEMPCYEDTELIAFSSLRELDIPPPLIAIGTRPLGLSAEDTVELGEGLAISCGPDGIERSSLAVKAASFAGNEPPVLPTEVSYDFGLMLFDQRYVEGEPSEASLERLLAIEDALRARAIRACPNADVTLTVTYQSPLHQQQLDAMLRSRNRHTLPADQRFRPPWWQFWRHVGRLR